MTVKQQLSHPKYRPDIDGLRALAVLAVVAFHAFPSWLKGGFIGVDVFFVISGYLISTIIFESFDKGTFSFTTFYARRIKRIYPALILVLIACLTFGWFALLADEYKQLGKHIAAGAGFVSNIVFWNEAGYFDAAAETKPLLHLWSLGVEEQFYIVWPLLLWLAYKSKFNILTIIVLVSASSFILNIIEVKSNAVAAFYSPGTRFWELLSGSLLAWLTLYKSSTFKSINSNLAINIAFFNIFSFVGICLLIFGFLEINKELSFPGYWAMVPVLGAVLIILAGPNAFLNRKILSNKVAVWFGLISFPLYLWHWPLLSFARIIESNIPRSPIRIGAILLSVALAYFTYEVIERPFRYGKNSTFKTALLTFTLLAIGCLGFLTFNGDGFSLRKYITGFNYDVSDIERPGENNPISHAKCMAMYGLSGNIKFCSVSTETKPNIALIGDSHADALYRALSEELKTFNKGVLNIGGRLFVDVATYPLGNNAEIEVYKGGVRATEFVADEPSIDTVILVSRGPFYLYSDWIFSLISNPAIKDRKKVYEIGMRKTLDRLIDKKQVIFVIDNPELDFDPRLCFKRPIRFSASIQNCTILRAQYDLRNQEYRDLINRVLKDYPKVKIFDAPAYFCDDSKCFAKFDGKVLYGDSNHLSLDGARLISKELSKVINGADSKFLMPYVFKK